MRYEIDGVAYTDARDVMDTYGASDYTLTDWQAILNGGPDACREGNARAFPHLSPDDIETLTAAAMDHATQMTGGK
ncbi:MAG TPA: hypothetical protein VNZ58_02490 [Thermomicrobiales bacterium]|nr:hypothetical protein [Thermomicrobiales bacterium]